MSVDKPSLISVYVGRKRSNLLLKKKINIFYPAARIRIHPFVLSIINWQEVKSRREGSGDAEDAGDVYMGC